MGVPRVSVRSQRTKRASSRLRAARAKAAHYICHHGLADFASWLRLFRESEKNSLSGLRRNWTTCGVLIADIYPVINLEFCLSFQRLIIL